MRWTERDSDFKTVIDAAYHATGRVVPLVLAVPMDGSPLVPVGCLQAFDTDEGWVDQLTATGIVRRTGTFRVVFTYQPLTA